LKLLWLSWVLPTFAVTPPEVSPPAVAPTISCPSSVAALALPDWANAADIRLQSKGLIVVLKGARRIFRTQAGEILRVGGKPACWPVGLGPNPTGHKQAEGDGKTPEGWYRSSDKPWSSFYKAIAVHYPNTTDAQKAQAEGRLDAQTVAQVRHAIRADRKPPQTTPVGGEILIHGGGGSTDWTLGCIAMDNASLDTLRSTLSSDMVTDVLILP
jgi:murein L,D-transpeptidase YafK